MTQIFDKLFDRDAIRNMSNVIENISYLVYIFLKLNLTSLFAI